MNRNRFVPPQSYNNDISMNSVNYAANIPRFNVWQSSLTPIQNPQPNYINPQAKKNYCSTCDMWTSEPYNNHQISPAHLTKKGGQRGNQNYQPSYSNINSSSSINPPNHNINHNNNNNSNNNNNNNNNKNRKFKRPNKRNRKSTPIVITTGKSSTTEPIRNIEEEKLDGNNLTIEKIDDKSQVVLTGEKDTSSNKTGNIIINKNRGQEMLIPVNGVFCALCEIFFACKDVAETEHCSSQGHCEAYEKLLKRVQETKPDKRPCEKSSGDDSNDFNDNNNRKRLKSSTTENQDKDFRILSSIHLSEDNSRNPDQTNDNQSSVKDGEEIDRNSTNEFTAPDFSLDFPDDMEDYDDMDVQCNSKPSNEKLSSTVANRDK